MSGIPNTPTMTRSRCRQARRIVWLAPNALVLTACLYDASDRCGDDQVFDGVQCVCAEGFGLVAGACEPCGDNEVGDPTGPCACTDGLVRLTPDGECTEALGQACESHDECSSAAAPYCATTTGGGYCTLVDCEPGGNDCPGDYACNDRGDVPFCERPPSGLGVPCSSDVECSGYEANFCESLQERACLVAGCVSDPNICHGDWVCCDLAILGTSLCVPPSQLSAGSCPAGGTLVSR